MSRNLWLSMLAALLAGCVGIGPGVIANPPPVSPSAPPAILSPTPPFLPSPTPTGTQPTPLPAASSTATAMIPSPTPTGSFRLLLEIVGCNTSLDLSHQMGEVTNAFPRLQNPGGTELTGVCAALSASDEARQHPDKTVCIPSLPAGYQVTLKLTVDTGFKQDTSIQVDVTTDQGSAFISRPSCTSIGLPGDVPDQVGLLQPIP